MSEQGSLLKITRKDLEDPEVYRLNEVLKFFQSQIEDLRNKLTIDGELKANSISTPMIEGEPSPNDVVPWGTLKRLLGPASQRTALIRNNFLGEPVRPLSGIDIPANMSGIISAIVDTHALRLSKYYASLYDVGSLYYETDRDSLYQVQTDAADTKIWVWIAGEMQAALASQPSDLGTTDEGFRFVSTTANALYFYRWNGSAWVIIQEFAESDRLVKYGSNAGDYATLSMERARGSIGSGTAVSAGDIMASVLFKALRNSSMVTAAEVQVEVEATPSASTAAGRIFIRTSDTTGSALTTRWEFSADGHLIPGADNTYDIGESGAALKKLWTYELNVDGGSAGEVLTNDGSGNAVWSPGSGTQNSYLAANASASLTLTTSFQDITGASVSINQVGTWLILGCFQCYKDINDDEVQGQFVFDGSAQTGITRMGAATTNSVRGTETKAWIVTTASQPKTAKLQAKKNAGTGTSVVDITNTSIIAIFLYT